MIDDEEDVGDGELTLVGGAANSIIFTRETEA